MTPVWWALGVVILVFAAREWVDRIQRRDRVASEGPDLIATPTEPIGAPGLMITTKPLTGIPEIRNFVRTNETPI
jgi:hypothetical protein